MIWWSKQQLKSKDRKVRERAVEKIVAEGGASALEALTESLHAEDPHVRQVVAAGLGDLRDERAAVPLAEALRDADESVRAAAAKALGRAGGHQAILSLCAAMQDGAATVRWQAARALEDLNWEPANNFEQALVAVALGKLEMAAGYGPEAIEPIAHVLRNGAYQERHSAVLALSLIPDARVQKSLIAALSDREEQVRCAAVEALRKLGGSESSASLIAVLRDTNKHVRAAAAEALSQMNNPEALEPLRQTLTDRVWEVRVAAALALGKLRDARSVEPLVAMLEDRDAEVREAAARALEMLGDRRAITALVLAMKDEKGIVRQRAQAALTAIDPKWAQTDAARAAAPQLQEALRHTDYWVRQSAADALGRLNQSQTAELRGMPVAQPALSAPLHYRRQAAVEAFLAMLSDFDRELRVAAADALGRLGQTGTIPALTYAMQDPDDEVRAAATRATSVLQNQIGADGPVSSGAEIFPF